ncbi:MAG TPA: hypothetical protein VK837_05470 [Longimicrobiales bacterium]|nr:hypothetical protein [Longimicrobiales bacterium]
MASTFAGDTTLALSKAAGAALAVGTAPRGFSFFDNFLPCPRRGLIDFAERGAEMVARAHGCDLGDGVTLDGAFAVALQTDGGFVVGADITGDATLTTPAGMIPLPVLSVAGLSLEPRAGREGDVGAGTATLTALGRTVAFDARGAPVRVFEVPEDILVANPGRAVVALTDVDTRRAVFDPFLAFAAILFDEQLEFNRGPHTHDVTCGTIDVLPDTTTGLTGVTASLEGCEFPSGTTIGGEFSASWTSFQETELTAVFDGALRLDGGLASVTLMRVEWTVEPAADLQNAVFRGELSDGGTTLPFLYAVPVSD